MQEKKSISTERSTRAKATAGAPRVWVRRGNREALGFVAAITGSQAFHQCTATRNYTKMITDNYKTRATISPLHTSRNEEVWLGGGAKGDRVTPAKIKARSRKLWCFHSRQRWETRYGASAPTHTHTHKPRHSPRRKKGTGRATNGSITW